ncbi:MAG: hypothetical protein PHY29_08015 [Syntrophales bacterium]|nr:hypothetical protein [Syntrophales bacterium]
MDFELSEEMKMLQNMGYECAEEEIAHISELYVLHNDFKNQEIM